MGVLSELDVFYKNFQGEKFIIGRSHRKKPIYCFRIKKTDFPKIIVQYAIHAREYITTYLAMLQIEDFIMRGKVGTVYFIPAVNPDGIEIAELKNPLYKANDFGVDLNVNFDALWGTGRENVRRKSDCNFIGERPFSEPETRALRDFTLLIEPHSTLSYHSKGEEIYWEFFQGEKERNRDEKIAKILSEVTGYAVKLTPDSAGGYKDWCISRLKIPSFTIEVGSDNLSHPIGKEYSKDVFIKNQDVITTLIESVRREYEH